MPRLSHENGVVVNVDDETAERLKAEGGWSAEAETKKAPAKKAASSKTEK